MFWCLSCHFIWVFKNAFELDYAIEHIIFIRCSSFNFFDKYSHLWCLYSACYGYTLKIQDCPRFYFASSQVIIIFIPTSKIHSRFLIYNRAYILESMMHSIPYLRKCWWGEDGLHEKCEQVQQLQCIILCTTVKKDFVEFTEKCLT